MESSLFLNSQTNPSHEREIQQLLLRVKEKLLQTYNTINIFFRILVNIRVLHEVSEAYTQAAEALITTMAVGSQ